MPDQTAPTSPPNESFKDEYVFPQHIVIDESSWKEFCSEMENPRPANAVLRAVPDRAKDCSMR